MSPTLLPTWCRRREEPDSARLVSLQQRLQHLEAANLPRLLHPDAFSSTARTRRGRLIASRGYSAPESVRLPGSTPVRIHGRAQGGLGDTIAPPAEGKPGDDPEHKLGPQRRFVFEDADLSQVVRQ